MKDNQILRKLPKVDQVMGELSDIAIQNHILKKIVGSSIADIRQAVISGEIKNIKEDEVFNLTVQKCRQAAAKVTKPGLVSVINGTGVLLHTNLGRSIVAADGLEKVLSGYCNLELDLATGERGDRNSNLEEPIKLITGCEAAIAVNNNAAAVMLVLSALARDRKVVVSRGEQVEIGGSFRIPEVAQMSGAKLLEVGATNITRIRDYEMVLDAETAMIMRVEPSNFSFLGQAHRPANYEIARVAEKAGIPFYLDLGSGILKTSSLRGFVNDTEISKKNINALVGDAGILSFSGDKLLGSTQAGIIVGKAKYIDKLRNHPLYRAFRLDKASLFLLSSSLSGYIRGEENLLDRQLSETRESIENRVGKFLESLKGLDNIEVKGIKMDSSVGGGTFSASRIKSAGVIISSDKYSPEKILVHLRNNSKPIIAMAAADGVRVDFRTVNEQDSYELIKCIKNMI